MLGCNYLHYACHCTIPMRFQSCCRFRKHSAYKKRLQLIRHFHHPGPKYWCTLHPRYLPMGICPMILLLLRIPTVRKWGVCTCCSYFAFSMDNYYCGVFLSCCRKFRSSSGLDLYWSIYCRICAQRIPAYYKSAGSREPAGRGEGRHKELGQADCLSLFSFGNLDRIRPGTRETCILF